MIEELTYKNKPILKITQEGRYTKVFIGLKKARLIPDSLEAIRAFLASHKEQDTMPI